VINPPQGIDLKALAHELLHEARQQLQEERHLTPTAVVITALENLIFEIEYEGDEEREEIYSNMVDLALEKNALAIITINDAYLDDSGPGPQLEGPGWGPLVESAREGIMITISGSGFETWSLTAPYFRQGSQFVFLPTQEKSNPGAEMELLGNWTGRTGAA
jgi:hypothetical protein